jgi:hypothetical protein
MRFGQALLRVLLAIVLMLAGVAATAAADARAAVAAFVAKLAETEIRDLVIEQSIVLYHPDGLHPVSRGEQRLLVKPPGRQRLEERIEGRSEIQVAVGDRTWIRRADGKTYETPPPQRGQHRAHLMVPLRRSADDLLATWRTLGVNDAVADEITVGRRSVTVIGAKAGDRESPAVWLDPDFGVVRFIGRETLPQGPAIIDLAFSEHRPLRGGFHFPHRQEVFVGGRLVLLITVRSVAVNIGLSDTLFDPDALRRER